MRACKRLIIAGLLVSVSSPTVGGFAIGGSGRAGSTTTQDSTTVLPPVSGGLDASTLSAALGTALSSVTFVNSGGTVSGSIGSFGSPAPDTVTYSSSTPSICTVSGATVTALTLGTCSITATVAADEYYAAGTLTEPLQITALDPGLSAPSGPSSDLSGIGDTYQFPSTLASGGQSFTASYGGSTTGVCSVSASGLVESLGVGTCPVTVSVAAQGLFSAVSLGPVNVAVVADGGMLLSGSDPISSDNLGLLGLPAATENDLQTNQNCGSVDCLTAFNTQKASTSCTALSAGATDAQVETFVNCVMNEVNDAVATAAIAAVDSTPTLPADGGTPAACLANLNLPVPSVCSHPQWDCSVTSSTPSGLAMTNNGQLLSMTANYNGVASTVTYNVRFASNLYGSSLVYNVPFTVSVPGTSPAITSYTVTNGKMPIKAYNACVNNGSRLATLAEIESLVGQTLSSYASHNTMWIYATAEIANTTTWSTCGSLGSEISPGVRVAEKYNSNWNSNYSRITWDVNRSQASRMRYRDSNNVAQDTTCFFNSGGFNASATYYCAQPTACPSN